MRTAAENLMLLGCKAVCALVRNHFILRMRVKPESVDPADLRQLGRELDRTADAIEAGRPLHIWGSLDIAMHGRNG